MLLDDHQTTVDSKFYNLMAWWEKRRLTYNLYVGSVGLVASIFACFINSVSSDNVGTFIALLIFGLFYLCFANLCYCLGWGIECLLVYYFKQDLSVGVRRIFYILGTLVSLLLPAILFGA